MKETLNERIIYLYCNMYFSLNQVANQCSVTTWTVRQILKEYNKKTRSISDGIRIRRQTFNISDQEILRLYNQGWSGKKISNHFKKCVNFAYSRLKSMGVELRTSKESGGRPSKLNQLQKDQLCNDYKNGMHIDNIVSKYNFKSSSPVYNILIKFEIKKRQSRINNCEEIALLYTDGLSGVQIANLFDISTGSVYRILRSLDEPIRSRKGQNNRGWKGGIMPLHIRIRNLGEYRQWRKNILERDNYTCQFTNRRGDNLNVHHKESFSKIYKRFLHKNNHLSPIINGDELLELAEDFTDFWIEENGITISEEIHKLIHEKSAENGYTVM